METQPGTIQNRNTGRRAKKVALGIIFFIMLMDVVGVMILSPVAPFIVQRYSKDALMVTMLTVIYATAQFFAAPLFGKLGDRFGRRPVLLASVFGSAVGYLIFGLGGALWVLFLSRLIDGITGGNMSTASAYIADISEPEELAQNFTLVGMAWAIGLVLGPALGAVFGKLSLEAPAYAAAVLSLLSVGLGFFFLPESLPKERRETKPIRVQDINPFLSIGQMVRKPTLGSILLVLCLFNFAFNGINNTEPLFLIYKFSAGQEQIGLQLVLIGITLAVVQIWLVPVFVRAYGEKRVAIICLVGQAVGNLAAFLTPFLWLMYPVTMLNRAVSAFIFPTLTALSTNAVSPREQGVLMGVMTALSSLMTILGPLFAGAVYDHVMPGAPYWAGAAAFLLAGIVLARTQVQAIRRQAAA
jgi:multidrug resistance protein